MESELNLLRLSARVDPHLRAAVQRVEDGIRALEQERDALQAFKDYVHGRLDEAGVATHPEGPHSAAGCRIGDRLDIVLGERDALREALEDARNTFGLILRGDCGLDSGHEEDDCVRAQAAAFIDRTATLRAVAVPLLEAHRD